MSIPGEHTAAVRSPWVLPVLATLLVIFVALTAWLAWDRNRTVAMIDERMVQFAGDYIDGMRDARDAARAETVDWRQLDASLAKAQQAASGGRLMSPMPTGIRDDAARALGGIEGILLYFRSPIGDVLAGSAAEREQARVDGLLSVLRETNVPYGQGAQVRTDEQWEQFIVWVEHTRTALLETPR